MSTPADLIPDEVLVRRVCTGEVTAFDPLVLRYKERLYSVIYNMTSNHEDTNDLLMEVFDKAFRSLASFKGESAFYTWIHRIALHRTINHLKKRKRGSDTMSLNEFDTDGEQGEGMELAEKALISDPQKQASLKELQIKLNESLQKLSDEHRAVVVLFDIEGMSHSDISNVMGCSEGTVRSRLHYAHKQLQKMLSSYISE